MLVVLDRPTKGHAVLLSCLWTANDFFKKNQESNDDKTITTVIVKVKVAFSISGHCERESVETNELSLFSVVGRQVGRWVGR